MKKKSTNSHNKNKSVENSCVDCKTNTILLYKIHEKKHKRIRNCKKQRNSIRKARAKALYIAIVITIFFSLPFRIRSAQRNEHARAHTHTSPFTLKDSHRLVSRSCQFKSEYHMLCSLNRRKRETKNIH